MKWTGPAAVLLAVLLAGCATPKGKVAVQPLDGGALGLGTAPAPALAADWWRSFGDPQLDRIMQDALSGNPDLDQALARVRAAQTMVERAGAARLPTVAIDGSEEIQRLSKVYMIPPPYGGTTMWVGDLQANLGWDLDFWGRQADLVRQARAGADAALLDRQSAMLALTGSVAETYIELFRAEQQERLAKDVLAQRQHTLQLIRVRASGQLASAMDVKSAAILVAAAQQAATTAAEQRLLVVHALALLAGRGADFYAGIGATSLALDHGLQLPDALPADLLARRPDIRASLARIAAASAGREAARKAFYPNVNLLGLVGLQAMGLGNLLTADAATAGAGAAIHLPLFEGGALRAAHENATAEVDAAIASYNGLVLKAVREAADALSKIDGLGRNLATQQQRAADLGDLRSMNAVRLKNGLGSRLDLIGSDTDLLVSEQQTINLRADQTIARIQLAVALGGGFQPTAAATAATAMATTTAAATEAAQRNNP